MFGFLGSDGSRKPSPALQKALLKQGLPSSEDANSLRVLTESGGYAGRVVQYFRVFDARQAEQSRSKARKFTDLDGHPALIVASGHIDQHGVVYLNGRDDATVAQAPAPDRVPAARGDHTDDEHLVFPGVNEPSAP
jgi:hypothetical protein